MIVFTFRHQLAWRNMLSIYVIASIEQIVNKNSAAEAALLTHSSITQEEPYAFDLLLLYT